MSWAQVATTRLTCGRRLPSSGSHESYAITCIRTPGTCASCCLCLGFSSLRLILYSWTGAVRRLTWSSSTSTPCVSDAPKTSSTSPVTTRNDDPGSTSVRRIANATGSDFATPPSRRASHAVIGARPKTSPAPVSNTAPGTSMELAEPPDGSRPITLSTQYPPMTPSPGMSSSVPYFFGGLRSPVRRTLIGDRAARRALNCPTTHASAGQPSRHTATVEASGRPSAGYQCSPGNPTRAMTSLTPRYPTTPSTDPTKAATTLSPALTRRVSFTLSPTSRRAASRRARDSPESRAQTERKMTRGSSTMHPRVNRKMSRVDGSTIWRHDRPVPKLPSASASVSLAGVVPM